MTVQSRRDEQVVARRDDDGESRDGSDDNGDFTFGSARENKGKRKQASMKNVGSDLLDPAKLSVALAGYKKKSKASKKQRLFQDSQNTQEASACSEMPGDMPAWHRLSQVQKQMLRDKAEADARQGGSVDVSEHPFDGACSYGLLEHESDILKGCTCVDAGMMRFTVVCEIRGGNCERVLDKECVDDCISTMEDCDVKSDLSEWVEENASAVCAGCMQEKFISLKEDARQAAIWAVKREKSEQMHRGQVHIGSQWKPGVCTLFRSHAG